MHGVKLEVNTETLHGVLICPKTGTANSTVAAANTVTRRERGILEISPIVERVFFFWCLIKGFYVGVGDDAVSGEKYRKRLSLLCCGL